MAKESLWEAGKLQDPNRSAAYIRRFEELIAQGADLHGEARCIDALAARSSRILDAGCGQGRVAEPFDVIVCAGNVLAFLAPGTSQEVLARLHRHLAKGGRLIVGFGAGHDYTFEKFFADAAGAGFTVPVRLATWDLRAWTPSSDFLVAVCEAEGSD